MPHSNRAFRRVLRKPGICLELKSEGRTALYPKTASFVRARWFGLCRRADFFARNILFDERNSAAAKNQHQILIGKRFVPRDLQFRKNRFAVLSQVPEFVNHWDLAAAAGSFAEKLNRSDPVRKR